MTLQPEPRASPIHHPLIDKDGMAIAAMRRAALPLKGKMDGPQARGPYDELMERTPDAADVGYEKAVIGGVPGIWCHPKTERPGLVILYLHGGAYVLGSAYSYRHFAGQIAARAGAAAFVADYRIAPEHKFPAAVDDARAVYRGLVEQGAWRIAIVGDSAGGGLALGLLSFAHSEARAGRGVAPVAAVALSPWTDLALTGASMQDRAEDDPLLTKAMLSTTGKSYLDGHDARDPFASPLYGNGNLKGLPKVQIHVGTSEILLDDSRRYAAQARVAGVEVSIHEWEGMTHVFPSSVGTLDAADKALDLIATFLQSN